MKVHRNTPCCCWATRYKKKKNYRSGSELGVRPFAVQVGSGNVQGVYDQVLESQKFRDVEIKAQRRIETHIPSLSELQRLVMELERAGKLHIVNNLGVTRKIALSGAALWNYISAGLARQGYPGITHDTIVKILRDVEKIATLEAELE
jgi:hypothetical protein